MSKARPTRRKPARRPKRSGAALAVLRRLEALAPRFGEGLGPAKLALLERLGRARLVSAGAVRRYHDILLYLRALPDDRALFDATEERLEDFERRLDLRRHAEALADSGIAGTAIHYPFFWPTADWLERRSGARLTIDWEELEDEEPYLELLERLALWAETPGLDEYQLSLAEWLELLAGPGESDAQFLVRRVRALGADPFLRQYVYERLAPPLCLAPGPRSPSRTRSRWSAAPFVARTRPLRQERPDLAREVRRPPLSIRALSEREGAELVELAREAMVTRERDLDAFMHGDPRDVRIVECGEGLAFACIGVRPERRLLLESVYGFLTLSNGVPIGYVLASALWGSAEIAYNVFEAWRGGEAAWVYGRALAMVRALFRVDSFTIYPYQLGHGNEEGLASGAWWFYQKLGFRPRGRRVLASMRKELARVRTNPRHRSRPALLQELSAENVYLHLGRQRDDVIGLLPLSEVGIAVSARLAERFGAERERATRELTNEAARLCGARALRSLPPGERLSFERWAPLITALPGVERWSTLDRRALAGVARAKGGRRESDFVALFDAHSRLKRALLELAESAP